MHMSFFTKRERGFLSKCLAQGMSVPQAAADEQAMCIRKMKQEAKNLMETITIADKK